MGEWLLATVAMVATVQWLCWSPSSCPCGLEAGQCPECGGQWLWWLQCGGLLVTLGLAGGHSVVAMAQSLLVSPGLAGGHSVVAMTQSLPVSPGLPGGQGVVAMPQSLPVSPGLASGHSVVAMAQSLPVSPGLAGAQGVVAVVKWVLRRCWVLVGAGTQGPVPVSCFLSPHPVTHRASPERLAHHFLRQPCPAVPPAGPGFCRATIPLPLAHLSFSSLADERDRVQKKTFTKWVNKHLIKHWRPEAQRHVNDLYEYLRDGHNLISLLEVLSGDTLVRCRAAPRSPPRAGSSPPAFLVLILALAACLCSLSSCLAVGLSR
ncbi:uncharacterized protein LOC111924055 [Cyanistes caeruleus]|uniref:uncharacterized protein LOC111924055 n=1 Tax=Cyanistes caeruleus TaxID=156563 RepID=UPI000CDB01B9|nr:uncharacterized protein LOC111924055 [Cyanistes caeruleus]